MLDPSQSLFGRMLGEETLVDHSSVIGAPLSRALPATQRIVYGYLIHARKGQRQRAFLASNGLNRRESSGGMEWLGVWNGWGYGIAIFRALSFQISEPEIWQKSLFLRNFKDVPGNSASEKYFLDSGKCPFHTPPIHTPTKRRPT